MGPKEEVPLPLMEALVEREAKRGETFPLPAGRSSRYWLAAAAPAGTSAEVAEAGAALWPLGRVFLHRPHCLLPAEGAEGAPPITGVPVAGAAATAEVAELAASAEAGAEEDSAAGARTDMAHLAGEAGAVSSAEAGAASAADTSATLLASVALEAGAGAGARSTAAGAEEAADTAEAGAAWATGAVEEEEVLLTFPHLQPIQSILPVCQSAETEWSPSTFWGQWCRRPLRPPPSRLRRRCSGLAFSFSGQWPSGIKHAYLDLRITHNS